MNGYEDYFGIDDIDDFREQEERREAQRRERSERRRIEAEKRQRKAGTTGFLKSRAFLSTVAVVIYVTAAVIILVLGNSAGKTVKQQEEATIAANILDVPVYPADYDTVLKSADEVYNGFLILVSNNYACRHDGIDLVNVSENYNHKYQITDYAVQANRTTLTAMDAMFLDFNEAVGDNDLMISCDYRSMELQQQLYDKEVEEKGEEEGSKWVAKPGHSEHQTGYAFDLTLRHEDGTISEFDGKGKYAWIEENCEKYGFIVRYPDDKTDITGIYHEPWHIRYVGVAHACYIKEHGLCFEEYIDTVKSYTAQKPLEYQDCWMNRWQIYYAKAQGDQTSVPVPKGKEYEISGNNADGFIVSVKMS